MLNIELLREAVEWVESDEAPQQWHQQSWVLPDKTLYDSPEEALEHACGTKACVAGHLDIKYGFATKTALHYRDLDGVTGYQVVLQPNQGKAWDMWGHAPLCNGQARPQWDAERRVWNHSCWDWPTIAARLLGLQSENDLLGLFAASNSAREIRQIAEDIARMHGQEL